MGLFHLARRRVHSTIDVRHRLRELLRETAQSVAVVTALLPSTSTPTFHGATLSSFASIALDPLPLVAFSLRVPSRMASALSSDRAAPASLVINVLSAAQPHIADRFARPDVHPRPFADPRVLWARSQDDGPPVLAGALGALACRLVCPSVPLARLGPDDAVELGGETLDTSAGMGLASELFIAQVLRVERVPLVEDDGEGDAGLYRLPLLYHRRRYTTVQDHAKP